MDVLRWILVLCVCVALFLLSREATLANATRGLRFSLAGIVVMIFITTVITREPFLDILLLRSGAGAPTILGVVFGTFFACCLRAWKIKYDSSEGGQNDDQSDSTNGVS